MSPVNILIRVHLPRLLPFRRAHRASGGTLLELLARRYDQASTVFCTQYAQKDWHQRLGSGAHDDAIMDRIVHNTIWVETGGHNMREHTAGHATA
ncbi:ATP-binding protein [Cryobacterium sp. 10I1]|uniref:ATP-binding protein n=1 Tax=Cryobacterium sp. 10I1 TaxID=3048578 RepID=UPI003A59867F